jgi:hypothetical protein
VLVGAAALVGAAGGLVAVEPAPQPATPPTTASATSITPASRILTTPR